MIFTDVGADEYEKLAPLAAKMFIENTKKQLRVLKPEQFENATEEELNSGADIADVLIRWQKENDLPPVSDVSAVSHTIQPIQQIQENPIMQEIRKYISPEYWTEVAVLIEDFDLELVSVTRIESEQ